MLSYYKTLQKKKRKKKFRDSHAYVPLVSGAQHRCVLAFFSNCRVFSYANISPVLLFSLEGLVSVVTAPSDELLMS